MNTIDEVVLSREVVTNVCEKGEPELSFNASEVMAKTRQNCVFIKIQDFYRKVMFKDILFLEASGSYCNIYLKDRTRFTVTHSLAETAGYLAEGPFLRVHRSFMVNLDYVDSYIGNLLYIGEHTVPIGRMYRKTILSGLNILGVRDV
ncbi:LytR/AlgR family response regulator transcription factor [Bacteroides sp.]